MRAYHLAVALLVVQPLAANAEDIELPPYATEWDELEALAASTECLVDAPVSMDEVEAMKHCFDLSTEDATLLVEYFDELDQSQTETPGLSIAAEPEDFKDLTEQEILNVETFMFDHMGFVLGGLPDGIMDTKTRAAYSMLQEFGGFPVTGTVSKEEYEIILEKLKEPLPPERQWSALSVSQNGEFVSITANISGIAAYREAEQACKTKYNVQCVTGFSYGYENKPAWVAASMCTKGWSRIPFVWFGASRDDAYVRVAEAAERDGADGCTPLTALKTDGTD